MTAPYKYPREIEFVAELPKTTSGKIRRVDLRRLEEERRIRGETPRALVALPDSLVAVPEPAAEPAAQPAGAAPEPVESPAIEPQAPLRSGRRGRRVDGPDRAPSAPKPVEELAARDLERRAQDEIARSRQALVDAERAAQLRIETERLATRKLAEELEARRLAETEARSRAEAAARDIARLDEERRERQQALEQAAEDVERLRREREAHDAGVLSALAAPPIIESTARRRGGGTCPGESPA